MSRDQQLKEIRKLLQQSIDRLDANGESLGGIAWRASDAAARIWVALGKPDYMPGVTQPTGVQHALAKNGERVFWASNENKKEEHR